MSVRRAEKPFTALPVQPCPPLLLLYGVFGVSLCRDSARVAYGHCTPLENGQAAACPGLDDRQGIALPVQISSAFLFVACDNKIGQFWRFFDAKTEGIAGAKNAVFAV